MARRGRRSKKLEEKISLLEDLTVEGAIRILRGDDDKKKFLLTKELAGKVLARHVKVSGEGENGAFEVTVKINNGNQLTQESGNRIGEYFSV